MPTYSYLCDACEKTFELEQRISEDPVKKCVLCGQSKAKRQIVSGNFILKGGGWYSDGYGNTKKTTKAEASANAGSSASGGKTEPSTGSKSEKTEVASPAKPDSSASKGSESKASTAAE